MPSVISTERRNWNAIFNGMVHMLRTQRQQLLSLLKDRKLLQHRIQMQHQGWESDIRLYKDQISQMKGILMFEEKKRLLDGAKADLVLGFKQKEASFFNYILEHIEDELADFKAWFEFLSQKPSDGEDQGKSCGNTDERKKTTEEEKCSNKLEEELRRSKREYDIALEKSCEHCEVEQANDKIEILVSSMEQLQSANDEKDGTISRLETGTKNSGLGCNNSSRNRSNLKKELSVPEATDTVKDSKKGNRSLKRKEGPAIPVSETPKLFSSNFKVPKLKNLSPGVR
ncbi:kinesin-related protein 4-like isoform X1 [Senna tora]|uniref:Kinesin-related protein 4-like isoform X1 n=1 Tax=Senna tora TaxID=362788 RepID=A0A834T9N6_9FABA|nr:kinesin-related protein 4-like isoform X1 [Senna tora]